MIRFKVPEVKVEFEDMIRGTVVFDAGLLGDIVIAKDLDTPLYNFAVVVDDELMEITHVIRGEDHISNTPKQFPAPGDLGFKKLIYAHLPLFVSPDRGRCPSVTATLHCPNTGRKDMSPAQSSIFLPYSDGIRKMIVK